MNRILTIILSLVVLAVCRWPSAAMQLGEGRDTVETTAQEALKDRLTYTSAFTEFVYDNPAMQSERFGVSYNEISLSAGLSKEDAARTTQKGNDVRGYKFDVDSYRKLSEKTTVWGGASYSNGKKQNVAWNSRSDYDVIYPYVVADSVGGDMKYEEYKFFGGYSHKSGRVGVAGEVDLRALHEYRDYDPRPRNKTLDVNFSLAASLSFGQRYMAAASFNGRIYRQEGDVRFYHESNVVQQWLMDGLGIINQGFLEASKSDTKSKVKYEGKSWSGSAELMPLDGQGLFAEIRYDIFSLERIWVDNEFPTNELNTKTILAEAAYLHKGRIIYGVKGMFRHTDKEGINNISGAGSGYGSGVIGRLALYENKSTEWSVSVLGGYKARSFSIIAEPYFGFGKHGEEYLYPQHIMETEGCQAGMKIGFTGSKDCWLLNAVLDGSRRDGKGLNLLLAAANMKPWLVEMVEYAYSRASEDYTLLSLDLRLDRAALRGPGIFIHGMWQHGIFPEGSSSDVVNVRFGITF